jgi:hypothetical protein
MFLPLDTMSGLTKKIMREKFVNLRNPGTQRYTVFFIISLLLLIAFRLLYSTPIEFNDESIRKWEIGRIIFYDGSWNLLLENHHDLRWSIIIPQIFLAGLSKFSYGTYFVTPIVFYSAFTVLCAIFFRREKNWLLVSTLLIVAVSFDPMGHAMASQLNSGAFGLFYSIVGFISALRYLRSNNIWYVVISGLFLFFAYGAHITYLIFGSGVFFLLIFQGRKLQGAIIFGLTMIFLFLVETAALSYLSQGELVGGRAEKLWDTKGRTNQLSIQWKGAETYELHHFFDRWRMLPKYNLLIAISFMFGSFSLFNARVRNIMPYGVWQCWYAALIYVIVISVPIVDFNPIRLALDLHSRYLAPFFPLALVFVVWLASHMLGKLGSLNQTMILGALLATIGAIFSFGSFSYRCLEEVGDIAGSGAGKWPEATYCRIFRYSQEQNIYPSPDFFAFRAQEYYGDFNFDYINGRVALFGGTRIAAFRWFIKIQYPEATFVETTDGWFSIDGSSSTRCIMELGQTKTPQENYRDCTGIKMTRTIFDR